LKDFQIHQAVWIHGERIIGKNHKVCQFASLDGSLGGFLAILVGGMDGESLQCLGNRNPLIGTDDITRSGLAGEQEESILMESGSATGAS